MKQVLNGYVRCVDAESVVESTSSGFETTTAKRFKKVKVASIAESDNDPVKEGVEVLISSNAGHKDPYEEGILLIQYSDIIYIF